MTDGLELVHFDTARRALALATSIDEVKTIRDKAEALRAYVKQQRGGLEMQNQCGEIKLRAERRAGELLREMEKNEGGRPAETGNAMLPVSEPPTLADLGIERMQSSRWQMIAEMPEEQFEQHIAETKADGKELTEAGLLRAARLAEPEPVAELPSNVYQVFYVDPPWRYGDQFAIDGYKVSAEMHYPTLSIPELCSIAVRDIAAPDAVLFLWATSPLLEDAFRVINAWGFQYKTSFVWDKIRHNFGHYNSVRHEFLLVCTRGSFLPECKELLDSVVSIERTEHSRKPAYFRELIERLYPSARKIELFAREQPNGWDVWGNEADVAREY